MDEAISDAIEGLRYEHGFDFEVEDRTVVLGEQVKGDPGNAVLRVLGAAENAAPVGAAARGPNGVAAGVWRRPELYLARWTQGRRWVVGYRLTGGSSPRHHVRTEGRIPSHFEIGTWHGDVPDEVTESFLEAGLLLDDPPFPVPPAPAPPPPPASPPPRPGRAATKRAPAAPRPARPPAPARPRPETTRVCPACRMHKAPGQFTAGSEHCVDCR